MSESDKNPLGFWVNDYHMAGLGQNPQNGWYFGYVVHQETGETSVYEEFPTQAEAVRFIEEMARRWEFVSTGQDCPGCSKNELGQNGKCGASFCPKSKSKSEQFGLKG